VWDYRGQVVEDGGVELGDGTVSGNFFCKQPHSRECIHASISEEIMPGSLTSDWERQAIASSSLPVWSCSVGSNAGGGRSMVVGR
jgi:hypothetical protein